MTKERQRYGKHGESIVAALLKEHGYIICAYNYATRHGEIDIVAYKDATYVFVEVKARKQPQFAVSSVVTPRKQHAIMHTAYAYLSHHATPPYGARCDVACVAGNTCVSYIPAAFTPEGTV